MVDLDVVPWYLLARPTDRCSEGALDGTGVSSSCVVIGWVLPDRRGKVGWGVDTFGPLCS